MTDGTPDDLLRRSRQRDPANHVQAGRDRDRDRFLVSDVVMAPPRVRRCCCWYRRAQQNAARERPCCCSSVCGSLALLRQSFQHSVQNWQTQIQPLDESANMAISNSCRAAFVQAWLPIVGLGVWWCVWPLAELHSMTALEFILTGWSLLSIILIILIIVEYCCLLVDQLTESDWPDCTDADLGRKWLALRPVLFLLLCYPSAVTTALLLRAVCTIHRQHADAIVGGIGKTFSTADTVHSQFNILRQGLSNTGQRWEGILFVPTPICLPAWLPACLPACFPSVCLCVCLPVCLCI